MSSKEQAHSNDDKASAKRQPATEGLELVQQQPSLATIQKARLDPRSLTPRNVLQLQRTLGNQAVGRLLMESGQRHPASSEKAQMVQRKIDEDQVKRWLLDGEKPNIFHAGSGTVLERRNYHDTMLFIELMQQLGISSEKGLDSEDKLDFMLEGAIQGLNQSEAITKEDILFLLEAFNLAKPDTPDPSTMSPTKKLLFSLEQRRGAYNWHGEVGPAMKEWLNKAEPLNEVLTTNSQINCWEAVLVAAVQASLISVEELRAIYNDGGEKEITIAVSKLFMRHSPTLIDLTQANKENTIKEGDVIMFAHSQATTIEHVAVVKTANTENYENIELYSLWNQSHGNSLITTKLGEIKANFQILRYLTL